MELQLSPGQAVRLTDSATGIDYLDWPDPEIALEVGKRIWFDKSTGRYPVDIVEVLGPRHLLVEFPQGWEA